MRCMKNVDGSWQKENPVDLSRWLYSNDGEDAVVVDDATKTYYCGRPEMVETYKAAWAAERKKGDNRKAAMFIDLDRQLFEQEPKEEVMNTTNAAPEAPYHPPQIDMIPVESSNIESVGHDGAETLRMKFKSGATLYDYVGVPEEKFIDLVNSPSVGKAWRGVVGDIKGYQAGGAVNFTLIIREDSLTIVAPPGAVTLTFEELGQIDGMIAKKVREREEQPQLSA